MFYNGLYQHEDSNRLQVNTIQLKARRVVIKEAEKSNDYDLDELDTCKQDLVSISGHNSITHVQSLFTF